MRLAELDGRRVALWGLGREGRATLRAIRRVLPELPLTVLDDASPPPEAEDVLTGDVRIVTGRDAVAGVLGDFDVVVKSPGISLYRPEVEEAKRRGVHVTSATRIWFAEHPDARAVCVTGTKGKSTTASLVVCLLRAAGVVAELRGNVGRPLLDPPEAAPDVWVVEVSSYQAADLTAPSGGIGGESTADPSVAVLLNLYPEHLDWHGDVATYYRDKLRLFAGQRRGVAVVNRADPASMGFSETLRRPVWFNDPRGFHVAGGVVRDGERAVLSVARIALPGAHNHGNVCAALTAVRCLYPEIEPASLVPAVESFRGLPHRLMPLGERDGVLYVDDSISTTPQSTMAALATFADRAVTVLVGGYERHLPYDELARDLVTRPVHAVVTLPPSGVRIAAAVRRELGASAGPPALIEAGDLAEAVAQARRVTPAGGVVLLSPAAPSYGAFRNFEERGDVFAREAGLGDRHDEPGRAPR
jgi:UDP-N-acetylmuramoylalanine--D-glutamate ligase